jgi:hypothetical protein
MATITRSAYSNVALSNATVSSGLGTAVISALGKVAETLYAAILTNSPTLSGDAPPTEANLQSRIAAPNSRLTDR